MSAGQVTGLLRAWSDGEEAALDQLVPLVEAELRRLSSAYMRRERQDHTLQTTALINEAFIRLVDAKDARGASLESSRPNCGHRWLRNVARLVSRWSGDCVPVRSSWQHRHLARPAGGAAVNRTADFPGGDEAPRWSPDGTQIAFWSAREGGGIFVMPALGGSARKIGPARPDVAASVAWSPDGTELVYPVVGSVAQDHPRLEVRTVKTGAVRTIPLSPTGRPAGCLDLSWSPDGRFLACLQANSYNNQTSRIWTLRLQDGVFTLITNNQGINWSPRWFPDSRTLLFTSDRGGAMDIWQQRLTAAGERAGEVERVTTGLDVLQIAITPDGCRLAYAQGKQRLAQCMARSDSRRPACHVG